MKHNMYQSQKLCEVCGISMKIPDEKDWDGNSTFIECPRCKIAYRLTATRLEKPDGWKLICNKKFCGHESFLSWDDMLLEEKPYHPTCEECGQQVVLERQ